MPQRIIQPNRQELAEWTGGNHKLIRLMEAIFRNAGTDLVEGQAQSQAAIDAAQNDLTAALSSAQGQEEQIAALTAIAANNAARLTTAAIFRGVQGNTTATTFTAANQSQPIAGNFITALSRNGLTGNAASVTYGNTATAICSVKASFVLSSLAAVDATVQLTLNGTVLSLGQASIAVSQNASSVTILTSAELNNTDVIAMQLTNNTDTSSITATYASLSVEQLT